MEVVEVEDVDRVRPAGSGAPPRLVAAEAGAPAIIDVEPARIRPVVTAANVVTCFMLPPRSGVVVTGGVAATRPIVPDETPYGTPLVAPPF